MAIGLGTPVNVIAESPANPQTLSVTVAGTQTALLVAVVRATNQTVDALSYAGSSILANTVSGATATQSNLHVDFYGIAAPTAGTNDISMTLSGVGNSGIYAWPLTGVDQTTPFSGGSGANGAAGTITVNVSSESGDLVIDAFICAHNAGGSTTTVGASQTIPTGLDEENYNGANSSGSSWEAGGATVTMSWTATNLDGWAIAAVNVNQAVAGTTYVVPQPQRIVRHSGRYV